MAPSEKAIIAALKSGVKSTYDDPATRELLTVRYVRDRVQEELGLEEGYFLSAEWKAKSKDLVKKFTTDLMEQGEAGDDETGDQIEVDVKPARKEKKDVPKSKPSAKSKAKAEPSVARGVKRESAATKGRPTKRQKKEATSSEDEDMDDLPSEDSAASESDFGDTEDSDAPKKTAKATPKSKTKMPVKKQRKSSAKIESEDEDDDMGDSSDAPNTKKKAVVKSKAESRATPVKRQAKSKAKVEDSGDESSLSDPPTTKDEDSDEISEKKPLATTKRKPKVEADGDGDVKMARESDSDAARASTKKSSSTKANVKLEAHKPAFKKAPGSDDDKVDIKGAGTKADASESEMSILIDEDDIPKPKKKRRSKSSPKPTKSKASKPTKAPASKDKDLSPDEITIKTLQSQLKKCGITKIWAFELKQYGDDTKARIKHLQKALNDVGMKGRFSEARAREIKEARELQADLEAVKEGEKSWGLDGGRAKRSAAGPKKNARKMVDQSSGDDAGNGSDEGKNETRSESEQPAITRKVNARSALAFLSSESDD